MLLGMALLELNCLSFKNLYLHICCMAGILGGLSNFRHSDRKRQMTKDCFVVAKDVESEDLLVRTSP